MTPRKVQDRSNEFKQRRFLIDHHYTVDELEWNRVVGASGLGIELLREMGALSTGVFNFEGLERIPTADGERFEFTVGQTRQTIHLDDNVSPTSTLLQGLRHLFVEVNTALRRAGLDWRYVLAREADQTRSFDYTLLLVPRRVAVDGLRRYDVIAGVDLKDYELVR
ncbi:MAG: hypothetical protein ABEN55_04605 [Bradymonadaceae bacterium]